MRKKRVLMTSQLFNQLHLLRRFFQDIRKIVTQPLHNNRTTVTEVIIKERSKKEFTKKKVKIKKTKI